MPSQLLPASIMSTFVFIVLRILWAIVQHPADDYDDA